MIRKFHPDDLTTAIWAAVDLQRRNLTFSNAGHLPFVKVSTGAATSSRAMVRSSASATHHRRPRRFPSLEGDRIIMVTDGLIERRGESLDVGLERLLTVTASLAGETLADAVDQLVLGIGPDNPEDDIAIIAFDIAPQG